MPRKRWNLLEACKARRESHGGISLYKSCWKEDLGHVSGISLSRVSEELRGVIMGEADRIGREAGNSAGRRG